MAYDIELCNDKGETLCGSDGNFNIDKRFGIARIRLEVRDYKYTFAKNFSHKFKFWTHFKYQNRIHKI